MLCSVDTHTPENIVKICVSQSISLCRNRLLVLTVCANDEDFFFTEGVL